MPKNNNVYVAIVAGGIGSRFWPYSRTNKPKQFLDVLNLGKTLIQLTVERFENICPKENIFIVTNEDYVGLVKEQLPELKDYQILAEPVKRNTAPCIAYVSQKIYEKDKTASIIVTPADHLILKQDKYEETLHKALQFIDNNDVLLTMGIQPTRPDTGYGYIQYEEPNINGVYKVKVFTEKPDLALAKTFIKSGDFLWNSGTFIWSARAINQAMEKYLPEIYEAIASCKESFYTNDEFSALSKAYAHCTSISIDYGIMEKADNTYVIPADFGWSDIGTWASLYEHYIPDYLGNVSNGNQVHIYDGSGNMIMTPKDKLVVINGLKDFCVIDTEDALVIFEKDREQDLKKITADLKAKN
ncbi:MAG: NTP transferase domain-containing protein [Chitinophagales bacterium]|nr:NTP transferase domain-containing protein [Chitinophagales bacterium]